MDNDVTLHDDLELFNEMVLIHADSAPEERLRDAEVLAQEIFDMMHLRRPKLSRGDQLLTIAIMGASIASDWRARQPGVLKDLVGKCCDDIRQR